LKPEGRDGTALFTKARPGGNATKDFISKKVSYLRVLEYGNYNQCYLELIYESRFLGETGKKANLWIYDCLKGK